MIRLREKKFKLSNSKPVARTHFEDECTHTEKNIHIRIFIIIVLILICMYVLCVCIDFLKKPFLYHQNYLSGTKGGSYWKIDVYMTL